MNSVAWLISIPLATSPLIYLVGHVPLIRRREGEQASRIQPSWALSLIVLAAMWVLLGLAARELAAGSTLTYVFGALSLRIDGLSLLTAALVMSLSTVVVIFSGVSLAGQVGEDKYYAMVLATSGAMIGMVCAADLFNLWMWFEAMMVASFLLVSFCQNRPGALDSSIKYLVQSTVGSMLALLGIALILAQTGSLRLDAPYTGPGSMTLLAAGALIILGFGVKSALVPMHTWLPDVYSRAPIPSVALFSGAVTVSGLIAISRALAPFEGAAALWGSLLLGFASLNMLAGNLLALRQTDVRLMLAYSSISHIGTILLGLGAALYTGTPDAAEAGLLHVLTHGAMKSLAFLAVGAALFSQGLDLGRPVSVSQLKGLARRSPLVALALLLAVFSLAGMPPLAGFISKWQVFASGMATQEPAIVALVVFAVLNTLLALGYYLPVVLAVFAEPEAAGARTVRRLPARLAIPLLVLIAAVLILGLAPDLARGLTEPAAAALMGTF
ncbi:MAG: hypothetical protein IPK19_28845 [Chloroflexi bacterium]|nr:hypothetical protein [Chloroflexota bacterium]